MPLCSAAQHSTAARRPEREHCGYSLPSTTPGPASPPCPLLIRRNGNSGKGPGTPLPASYFSPSSALALAPAKLALLCTTSLDARTRRPDHLLHAAAASDGLNNNAHLVHHQRVCHPFPTSASIPRRAPCAPFYPDPSVLSRSPPAFPLRFCRLLRPFHPRGR